MGDVKIEQVFPRGPAAVYVRPLEDPAKPTLNGGWQVVGRPRRKGATEWQGFDPVSLSVPIMVDGFIDELEVETIVRTIESFMRSTPQGEPPVMQLSGPIPFAELLWVLNGIEYGETLRRPSDNARIRQAMTLTFLEYVPIEIVTAVRVTPVAAAQRQAAGGGGGGGSAGGSSGGGGTYTVKRGDTLASIAARQLGNSGRWHEIADMNGIRDSKSIRVGQVLRMPGGSASASTTRTATATKSSKSGGRTNTNTEAAARAAAARGRKIPF